MRKALLVLFTLVCAAGGVDTASAATCANADTAVTELSRSDARSAVLCIVNAERNARGLPSVHSDTRLMIAAQRHTGDMVRRNYFEHVSPSGSDPGDRITAAGYVWTTYGENIAAGYLTPRTVMQGWMASEGHCENILNPAFTEIGVGVTRAAATLGGSTNGTWTQEVGRAMGAAARSFDTGPQHRCPYGHLIGLDAAGNVTAKEPPVAGSANDVGKLSVGVGHQGTYLIIRGRLAAKDGTKVRLTILRHGKLAAWGTAHLLNGRFAFRVPRGMGDRFVIRAAGKRVSRSLR